MSEKTVKDERQHLLSVNQKLTLLVVPMVQAVVRTPLHVFGLSQVRVKSLLTVLIRKFTLNVKRNN